MERLKTTNHQPKTSGKLLTLEQVQLLGGLLNRMRLGAGTQQYGGDRDIYQALGYLEDPIKYEDYLSRYFRQDIAKAIIDRPVRATWQGSLELIESGEAEDTPLEEAWEELSERLKLKTKFSRVDRLCAIGHYGVLLLGLDDVKTIEDFVKPARTSGAALSYVKPFGEASATIAEYVINPKDPRYGLPLIYEVKTVDLGSGNDRTVRVHYTRVIHIVTDTLESEVEGIPVLEAVFNRLMDLEKLVGGDAEMFWRGARPGYSGKVDKDYQMTQDMIDSLKQQADEYEHNLRRLLINEGVDLTALAQQIADPAHHVDIQIQMISAVTGIPKRILTGSERGELSSAQDSEEWSSYVQSRRAEHAELLIVRPFIDRCIELGILPPAEDSYTIKWPDLFALSEKARVEVGKSRANALREYVTMPMAEAIIPPKAFLQYFLGFTQEQIELVNSMMKENMSEEELQDIIAKTIEMQTNPPVPAGPAADNKLKRTAKPKTESNG